MANVKHANLTGANLHEPKGAASASANTVYVANGGGSGEWKKINQADNIDYSNVTKNQNGWNYIGDNAYTSAAPRSITAGTRTLVTNDGLKSGTNQSRLGQVWTPSSSKFLFTDLNSAYCLRVSYKARTSAQDGTPYSILLEAEHNNPPGTVIYGATQSIKGGNYINQLVSTDLFFIGSNLVNSDLKLYMTPDAAVSVFDISFLIQRTYKES